MKAVIFDLGNVLIPYDHEKMIAAVAQLCGATEKSTRAVFAEISEPFGLGRLESSAALRLVSDQLGCGHVSLAAFAEAFAAGLSRDDVALRYAVALQQRPGLAVAAMSNTNPLHVIWLDQHVPELDDLELVLMSSEVEMLKPDPRIFRLALDLIGVAAKDALFVDDVAENVAAAASLGMVGLLHRSWALTRPAVEAWLSGFEPG